MFEKFWLNKTKEQFQPIVGFTRRLQAELEEREPSVQWINKERITSMPTYQFAVLALENESPAQVVNVLHAIRKRYQKIDKIDSNALGFLDCIEGKAYGYISLNTKNEKESKKFYDMAIKCFENGYSRGYYEAKLDLADLEKKRGYPYVGETEAFKVLGKTPEIYTCLGELFYDFSKLSESAVRVIEGKRPLISDIMDFKYSMWKYESGAENSINCKFYYGLALIIYNNDGSKEKGLHIVKETFEEFKEANANIHKVLFESDAKKFKENINLIEKRLLRIPKR